MNPSGFIISIEPPCNPTGNYRAQTIILASSLEEFIKPPADTHRGKSLLLVQTDRPPHSTRALQGQCGQSCGLRHVFFISVSSPSPIPRLRHAGFTATFVISPSSAARYIPMYPLYDTRFLCHQKDRVGQTKRIQKAFSLHGCEKISASRDATFAASSAVMLRIILIRFPFLLWLPAPCALFPPGTAGDIPGGVPPRSPFFPLCNTACQAQQPRRPAACSDVRAHRNAAP